MNAREQYIADKLACPHCGSKEFDEISSNAAISFRCVCGLRFNFMPVLRDVQITYDPNAGTENVDSYLSAFIGKHEPPPAPKRLKSVQLFGLAVVAVSLVILLAKALVHLK